MADKRREIKFIGKGANYEKALDNIANIIVSSIVCGTFDAGQVGRIGKAAIRKLKEEELEVTIDDN